MACSSESGGLRLVRALGPGLIAGAADNDPTTVATLAVIGSTTGYRLAWLVVLVIPMLVVVQVISARVGVVCRAGLAGAIRVRYGRPWAVLTLLLVPGAVDSAHEIVEALRPAGREGGAHEREEAGVVGQQGCAPRTGLSGAT